MAKVKAYYKHELSGLTATATAAGYDVDNLLIFTESDLWKGVGTGDHTITFDAGANKTTGANYLAIANHNLSGATVVLQYSNDNFAADINNAWSHNISSFLTSVFDASATIPQGISYAPDGTLWVIDSNTDKVYNIETDGTLISSFLTSVFDASAIDSRGISYAADGTLWIVDTNTDKVYNIETNGTLISSFATSVFDASATTPSDISYAPDGTLWVSDSNTDKIYNIETDGTLISSFPTSVFDASAITPRGIAYAPNDTLWVADTNTDKVYNIETNGTIIKNFPVSTFDPAATNLQGITIAPDGTLWVCDADVDKIYNVLIPEPIYNKSFIREFDTISSRYWRIKLSGLSSVPFMGLAYWGLSSEWDYPSLFDPNAESNKANVNTSPTGYLLAINNKYIERSISLKFKRADDGGALWLALKQWWDNHGLNLMFIAWDTDNHPDDIYLVYPDRKFRGPFTTANRREVSLTFKGRVS
jgi:streptogramin lyase